MLFSENFFTKRNYFVLLVELALFDAVELFLFEAELLEVVLFEEDALELLLPQFDAFCAFVVDLLQAFAERVLFFAFEAFEEVAFLAVFAFFLPNIFVFTSCSAKDKTSLQP